MRDVKFGLSTQYDTGIQTGVAINNKGKIVEVHRSEVHRKLWYRTGETRQMHVSWSACHEYDNGEYPSVALNDNDFVVEVHKSQSSNTLWLHVGKISGKTVAWGASHKYDNGVLPSIALDNYNWCVEVHRSQKNYDLWYHVGYINGSTVVWGSSHKYDSGYAPKVAMNNNGVIVEVHKSEGYQKLYYRVGTIDKNNRKINWGSSHYYDGGSEPSVAITDDGFVIETHTKLNSLYRCVGTIDISNKKINWYTADQFDTAENSTVGVAEQFDTGENSTVAVAFNGSMAIQTHHSGWSKLWFSTSLVVDRKRWMEELYDTLRAKPLWQVTLPGSHDSGAYKMKEERSPCSESPGIVPLKTAVRYATTHNLTMQGQLNEGARYFDIRLFQDTKDGKFYAYHDVVGAEFETMLNSILSFLKETKQELLILYFSHFCNFTDKQHMELISLITTKLKGYLVEELPDNNKTLLTTTIEEYVGQGSKAIILYQKYVDSHPSAGIWWKPIEPCGNNKNPYIPWEEDFIYDCYSDTDNYGKMEENQLKKLKNYSATNKKLFLLSWTLTFKFLPNYNTLHELSKKANRMLGKFLADNIGNYKINIIFVDFLRDARVTDCAIMLNSIDLAVTKAYLPVVVVEGQQLTYTVTVSKDAPFVKIDVENSKTYK